MKPLARGRNFWFAIEATCAVAIAGTAIAFSLDGSSGNGIPAPANIFASITNEQMALQGLRRVAATDARPSISEQQARAAVEAQGGTPVAAHLIQFVFEDHTRTANGGNAGPFVREQLQGPIWAVEVSNPPPAGSAAPGEVSAPTPAAKHHAYNIKFVNASTGKVIMGISGTLPD